MVLEWANDKTRAKIEQALTPPASYRDPSTGLPLGWSDNEADDWHQWERSMRR